MRSRMFALVALVVVLLLAAAGAVYAYDSARSDRIAKGVTIAGVDVGGLSSARARERLRAHMDSQLHRQVVVAWHGRRFTLSPRAAHVTVDIAGSVDEAVARSREGSIFTRTARNLFGHRLDVSLEPRVSFSSAVVDRFIQRIAATVNRPVREADVSFGLVPRIQPGQDGLTVETAALRRSISAALTTPDAQRDVTVPTRVVHPHRSTAELARRYPVIITVSRSAFRLQVYRNLRLAETFPIAVGQQGLETPAGLYHVQDKEVNPSWHVPNSAWAGSLAGHVIPPGPDDPIKARWLGIYNGAGIHGTDETWSIGHAASHGCIRMLIPDVIKVYDETPVGAPVFIQ